MDKADKIEILSIIPARGNSKSLPRKNIHPFCHRPLIHWTIAASLNSRYISRTVVSSDSDEILSIARKEGADAIKRPAPLALDNSSSESAVDHVLEVLAEQEQYEPQVILLLQATSPLRTAEDIDKACDLYFREHCTAVISGYRPRKNPLKNFLLGNQGYLQPIRDDQSPFLPRQELPEAFCPNGAIYIVDALHFKTGSSLFTNETRPYFMTEESSIDIDDLEDLRIAEQVMQKIMPREKE